jgi:hypothetical protein
MKKKRVTKKKAARKVKSKAKTKAKPKKTYDRDSYHLPIRSEYELTVALAEDLQDAWKKIRRFADELGEQTSHTSAKAMMFNRSYCYMFMRPKKSYIELVFFLREEQDGPPIFKTERRSKTKVSHIVRLIHEDQVESPLTDWIAQSYLEAE